MSESSVSSSDPAPHGEVGSLDRDEPRYIIGVGASAGGLEAISALLANLPLSLRVPVLVAQHLSPTHRSMMVELVGRATTMQVVEAQQGGEPQAGVVYIAPENCHLMIRNGRLHLSEPSGRIEPKPSVNTLFTTIAAEFGEGAIGVVLSGTGTDGADGARAIRAAGGFVLAQEPASAKQSGMPQAAIDTGCVDIVQPPELLAVALQSILSGESTRHPLAAQAGDGLAVLLRRLLDRSGVDFSYYKSGTIIRRIRHRLLVRGLADLAAYSAYVDQHPQELDELAEPLTIPVTSFFRDDGPFEALRSQVEQLVRWNAQAPASNGNGGGRPIRIWVAGCCTGQEAYSVAILFAEVIGPSCFNGEPIKIFATDTSALSLARARSGRYSAEEVKDLPLELQRKYLSKDGNDYLVAKSLRDWVVFSRQDLTCDPPFSRVDLVTCRNVLIYLKPAVQQRVIAAFRQSLRDDGVLFLGSSEGIAHDDDMFEPIDYRARLYRARPGRRPLAAHLPIARPMHDPIERKPKQELPVDYARAAERHYLPPGLIVNSMRQIEQIYGDVSQFLKLQPGRPSLNLFDLIERAYRAEAVTLIQRAQKTGETVVGRRHRLDRKGGGRVAFVTVHPIDGDEHGRVLVTFRVEQERAPRAARERDVEAVRLEAMEEELKYTREQLQSAIESLQTSNEELQSLNEELQATNEELQTSNEELQTSNEELQSTNEELTTVNDELSARSRDLNQAKLELETLYASADFAFIAIDTLLRVVHANDKARRQFTSIDPRARSGAQLLFDQLRRPELAERMGEVMKGAVIENLQIEHSGRHFDMRASRWENHGGEVLGVVLVFIDRTDLTVAEHTVRATRERLLASMDHSESLIAIKDVRGRYQYANPRFLDAFGLARDAVLGATDEALFPGPTGQRLAARHREILQTERALEWEETIDVNLSPRVFLTAGHPIRNDRGEIESVSTSAVDITSRKQAEEANAEHRYLLQTVLDSTMSQMVVLDRAGRIIEANRVWEREHGDEPASTDRTTGAVPRTWIGMHHQEAARRSPYLAAIAPLVRDVLDGRRDSAFRDIAIGPPGSERWYWVAISKLRSRAVGAVVSIAEITERKRSEEHLRLVSVVFENTSDGIVIFDGRRAILTVNRAFARITGLRQEDVAGKSWRVLGFGPRGRVNARDVIGSLRREGRWQGEATGPDRGAGELALWISVSTVRGSDGRRANYVVTFTDMSALKDAQKSVYRLAYHDPLTNLPNRSHFAEHIAHALALARRHHTRVALLFIDLDRFKLINDTFGHEIGDRLLVAVADRFREAVRRSDTIVRLGGDEFIVVLEDLRSSRDAAVSASKMLAALREPFSIGDHELYVSASIGIASFPEDGDSVVTLVKNADSAMYRAKEEGRNRYQWYTDQMQQESQRRVWIDGQLRRALDERQFHLDYQLQHGLRASAIRGIEVLLRWQHPERGDIRPREFIPVAEETGLIVPIGEWVLDQACLLATDIAARRSAVPLVSVNVSPQQLREPGFVNVVRNRLRHYGLAASSLELELTESALVQGDDSLEVMRELKALGVKLALDDFGTGYSSLTYLKRFPIDTIKIDQTFVNDVSSERSGAAIVKAMLALAEVLGLDVVAEGVETSAQLATLREWACPNVQGFLMDAPIGRSQLLERLN